MNQPVIFNIQKFCVHDGPGIRTTVFFKGCPLRCAWCHNPESQIFLPELLYNEEKCTGCGQCLSECPSAAITRRENAIATDRSRCQACGQCVNSCLRSAREIAGYTASVAELVAEIEKDRVFYEQSGGGVTLSGGEVLCQSQAAEALAIACKTRGIHVAIDTCGHVPYENLARLLDCTDLFLYDLKHLDPSLHKEYTGQDNRLILDNLCRLSAIGAAIFLRIPLIEGFNAGDEHINALAEFCRNLTVRQIDLLPYHNTGSSKYQRVGRPYNPGQFAAPSPERLDQIKTILQQSHPNVTIGGN
ncbi:MAG TPA: glycyl-radical enzyme activating protein [Negativicutes bacterium]|nr:glycyl-radical enzyme activating protein [Negativicutes bacterium]